MAATKTFILQKILPDIPDSDDKCITLLQKEVSAIKGIIDVHLSRNSGQEPRLSISYYENLLSEENVTELINKTGEQITRNIGHLLVSLEYINHAAQANTVTKALQETNGIIHADASATGHVRAEFDRNLTNEREILNELKKFDDEVSVISNCCHNGHEQDHDHQKLSSGQEPSHKPFQKIRDFITGETELLFSLMCGTLLLTGWVLDFFDLASSPWPLVFYVGAYFFGGFYTSIDVYQSLRNKKFDIHLLMLVAALGAATLGAWAEGALLLFLFSLGHSLEHYAMGKARKAISALADLTPDSARVRRDNQERVIPIKEIRIGDTLIIKPGEKAAADGVVVRGESSMDQAPITGESVPVDKLPAKEPDQYTSSEFSIPSEHRIFAGSINGDGLLDVLVLATPEDSTIARVIQMVREAETQKSPTQRFAERFERWFVPAILIFVSLLLFAWVIIDEPFSDSFYRAMAVMVAASPCALAISTPSAILSGIARSAKLGILIKGGGPLEVLSEIDILAFDKTGTITEGNPKVTDIFVHPDANESDLLMFTLAVEEKSDHPIARSVSRDIRKKIPEHTSLPEITSLQSVSGKGLRASSGNTEILIGNAALFAESLPADIETENNRLLDAGKTTMIIKKGDHFLGIIAVMDIPRDIASEVIAELKTMGKHQLMMISGDHQKIANQIGRETGLDKALGGLLPQDKARIIRELMKSGKKVAMIGDGVNDAPAMAHASVGIAMGAAGSDVALETADVALMGDDLRKLPVAIRLSKATRAIIKQNLFISLGMIAFLVPVTLFGYANMGVAVLLHEGSTLVVVLNALRLLGFRT